MYKNKMDISLIQDLVNHGNQCETLSYIGITQEDKGLTVKSLDL